MGPQALPGLVNSGLFDLPRKDESEKGVFNPSSSFVSLAVDAGQAAAAENSKSGHVAKNPLPRSSWPFCVEDSSGIVVSCRTHCKCGWGQQCYPKWWPPEEQLSYEPDRKAPPIREDRGVC